MDDVDDENDAESDYGMEVEPPQIEKETPERLIRKALPEAESEEKIGKRDWVDKLRAPLENDKHSPYNPNFKIVSWSTKDAEQVGKLDGDIITLLKFVKLRLTFCQYLGHNHEKTSGKI